MAGAAAAGLLAQRVGSSRTGPREALQRGVSARSSILVGCESACGPAHLPVASEVEHAWNEAGKAGWIITSEQGGLRPC